MGKDSEVTQQERPIQITISDDNMYAYLTLGKPEVGNADITEDDIYGTIEERGIKGEINRNTITEMVRERKYGQKRLIAEGSPCVDGTDGYFEYFFHQKDKDSGKPRILDDGSVDYTSINTVGTVSDGDLIAVYHPSVPGHFGYSVLGELLKPKPPKGLPVPQLIGCRYEEETYSYYATMDGKVEATTTKIQVIGTLEINRNINVAYGSIYFIGDVIIHGDVDSGVEITATGSVNIGGTVQGSSVKAGEDISISGGILGDERTFITCGGNLETRFMQYANVVAGGTIKAKSILDCTVRAGDMIIVEDARGSISGGALYSTKGVDGQTFGNRRGVRTIISVGKSSDVLSRRVEYGKLIEELDIKLMGVNSREIQLGREAKVNPAMSNLLHIVRQNKARLLTERKQIEVVYNAIDSLYGGQERRPYIEGRKFYPGVIVRIDMREKRITDEMIRVSFRSGEDGISFSYERDDKED